MRAFVTLVVFISFYSTCFATICVANRDSSGAPGVMVNWFDVNCSDGTSYVTKNRVSLIFVIPLPASAKKKNANDLAELMMDLDYRAVANIEAVGETDVESGKTKSYFAEDYYRGLFYSQCIHSIKVFDDDFSASSSYCILSQTEKTLSGITQLEEKATYLVTCSDKKEEIKYNVTFEEIDAYMQAQNYTLAGSFDEPLSPSMAYSVACAIAPKMATAQFIYKK